MQNIKVESNSKCTFENTKHVVTMLTNCTAWFSLSLYLMVQRYKDNEIHRPLVNVDNQFQPFMRTANVSEEWNRVSKFHLCNSGFYIHFLQLENRFLMQATAQCPGCGEFDGRSVNCGGSCIVAYHVTMHPPLSIRDYE